MKGARMPLEGVGADLNGYPDAPEGWAHLPVVENGAELLIGGWQVMQAWEEPLMDVMAREAAALGGDVLEVGFGMGISAARIVAHGCATYTVIEAHPLIARRAQEWGASQKVPVTVIPGLWQDVYPAIDQQFDGILFDTYPLSERERGRTALDFIPVAPKLLRSSGRLTYYSDETVRFRSEHLSLLFDYFDEVKLLKVSGLCPYEGCEYWAETHMIVPVASLPRASLGDGQAQASQC